VIPLNLIPDGIFREPAEDVGSTVLEQEFDRRSEALFGFLDCLSLAVGSRDFRANRPVTAFGGRLDDCSEFGFHLRFVVQSERNR